MRFVKIAFALVVTLLAMLASFMVALAVGLIGLIVYLFLRLRGQPPAGEFRPPARSRPPPTPGSEVIDVTATEVPSRHSQP